MMCPDDYRIETLIAEVEQNPMLYDKSNSNFKNVTRKRDMWQEIGMRTGMSADLARKKWANVRDAFNSSRKKVAGDKAKSIKKYKFADLLTFLEPHLPPVEPSNHLELVENLSEEENYSSMVSIVEHTDDEYTHIKQENHHDNTSYVPLFPTSAASHSVAKKRKFDLNHSIVDYLAKKAKMDAEKDELDYFFCSMAETVRKMPERMRVELKFNIHQMVHKAELQLLD